MPFSSLFLCLKSCPHDCIQQPHCVRYIVVFVPNADWPIMPDCVPWGKHSPRVVSEWPNYALALNVTMGSPGPLQKVFLVFAKPQVTCSDGIISQRIVWKSLLFPSMILMVTWMPWAIWALMRSFQVGVKVGFAPFLCPIWPLCTQPNSAYLTNCTL